MSDQPLAYDTSLCLHDDAIAREPFALLGEGATVRPLRRFDDGGLRSGIVDLPAGWTGRGPLRFAGAVQLFVRRGALALGAQKLGENGFAVAPAGEVLPALRSEAGAEIILILDDPRVQPGDGDDAIVTGDVFAIEPIIPVIGGKRLEGFERRVLWEDPATGADTRLLRVPAGFGGSGGPSFHPVEEEIFCLAGDIEPDPSRPMRAGSYLWNQKLSVHGFAEQSRGGCVLLEWHDGPWAIHRYEAAASERR